MRSKLALVLMLAVGCAKPSELANRTCYPTASWGAPAYSCTTGVPASSSSSSSSSDSKPEEEVKPEGETGGEIEMGGEPAPDEDKGKGKGKGKKDKEAEKAKEREEKEREAEKEKEKAKDREKEKESDKDVVDVDDADGGEAEKGGDKRVSIDGDEIRLEKKIIFKKDSDEVSTKSKPHLDDLVAFLSDHEEIKKIEVAGYTDNKGDKAELKKLSSDRAKAVKDYLVEHGIKAKRVTSKGYGSENPIASNKTKAGRQKNRRIEIHILKKK